MKRHILSLLLALFLLGMVSPAASAEEGGPIRIALIDTGVSTAAVSPDRIAEGRNYIRPQDSTEDKLGHGTAVSAIIAGSEAAQIQGICPTATLVPLVYCSKDETGRQVQGDTAMVAQAIYDAVDVYRCHIINISSGSVGGSSRLKEAVEYAEKRGVLMISCAGNSQESDPGLVFYPGGYESVLCVGACDSGGAIASFSQQNDTVDLLALGTDLRFASIRGTRIRGQGTSFSTAVVTGAAAQIWTNHPDLTADEVRRAVLASTSTVDGWQVLDLKAALAWPTEADGPVFFDVPKSASYYDAVLWAVEHGITGGTGSGQFSPDMTCTRGQIVTFLWRAAGDPDAAGARMPFTDVPAEAYYARAVQWAVELGITAGTSANTFSPDAPCTQAQVLVFLWQMLGQPDSGVAPVPGTPYYEQAVLWASGQGLLKATGFSAEAPAPRAHFVAYLYACRDFLPNIQLSSERDK